jgi:hypothetical protein
MADQELTVEQVESEATQIELRIILGTQRPADLARREVLRASRQHIQAQLSLARRSLSVRQGVHLVFTGQILEARIRNYEKALLTAPILTVEQPEQGQAQPNTAAPT